MISPHKSTVLIAPEAVDSGAALRRYGFHVSTWPAVAVQPSTTSDAIKEAIENLYGYDWVIFVSEDAVHFFLKQLREGARDVSDLDSLRVCAIGEQTATALERQQVHVDVMATNFAPHKLIDSLATYLCGQDSLTRLNFLIPQAAIGRAYLQDALEEAGARADVVPAYQTVADVDITPLIALQTMLHTGSIDAVVFWQHKEIENFARLFDTRDLSNLLMQAKVVVSCDDQVELAEALGVSRLLKPADSSAVTLAATLAKHLA